MRDRGDVDLIIPDAIKNGVGKPVQDKPPFAAPTLGIADRSLQDSGDCTVDLEYKSLGGDLASLRIPSLGFDELLAGLRMKPKCRHPRRKSLVLTSSHGMVGVVPASISRHLRSASRAQISSTSGSGAGSKLSIKRPANVALSPSGSSNASLNTFFRSRPMPIMLPGRVSDWKIRPRDLRQERLDAMLTSSDAARRSGDRGAAARFARCHGRRRAARRSGSGGSGSGRAAG
jgi:hypothetical protein